MRLSEGIGWPFHRGNAAFASAALCLGGSIVSTVLFYVAPSTRADLEVLPGPVQQLGEVRQGTVTKVTFALRNVSSKPISILNVGTSCGCTRSQLSQAQIAPQSSSLLTLLYSAGETRGPIAIEAIVVCKHDGGRPRKVVLRAQGRIDPEFSVTPEQVAFEPDGPSIERICLSPRHVERLRVTKAVCDQRFFAARVVAAGPDEQQVVEVAFDPSEYYADAGPAHVSIHTDCDRQPIVMVPLSVTAQSSRRSP